MSLMQIVQIDKKNKYKNKQDPLFNNTYCPHQLYLPQYKAACGVIRY